MCPRATLRPGPPTSRAWSVHRIYKRNIPCQLVVGLFTRTSKSNKLLNVTRLYSSLRLGAPNEASTGLLGCRLAPSPIRATRAARPPQAPPSSYHQDVGLKALTQGRDGGHGECPAAVPAPGGCGPDGRRWVPARVTPAGLLERRGGCTAMHVCGSSSSLAAASTRTLLPPSFQVAGHMFEGRLAG